MYRYRLVILFIAPFFAPFILAFDLPYGDLEGLAVEEALHYFTAEIDDCDESSDTSTDDGYSDDLQFDAQKDWHAIIGWPKEQDDLDEDDFVWSSEDSDEEPCSAYMNDDEANDLKVARREKRARDIRKDRPYRKEYVESVRNLDGDWLTKQVKRQFYNDAQKNYLWNKLSKQKAAKLIVEPPFSRRQNKIESAFFRMVVKYEKQNENEKLYPDIEFLFFAENEQILEKEKKCLKKSNTLKKNGLEVVVDKRCQKLGKTLQIRQTPNKTKFREKKKLRKELCIERPKQPDIIHLPCRQKDCLEFPSQRIMTSMPKSPLSFRPACFWSSYTMPYCFGL